MAIATPGQALTAGPPCGGVTLIRLTTRATTSPASAMAQPEYTRAARLRSSSAPNAGSTRPAVTQTGGSPGPPGLTRSSDSGRNPAAAMPGPASPASSRKAAGLANRWKVQGRRTTPGTTATITALSAADGGSRRHAASAASAAATAIAQISGTNAAATAISRAAAQAALRVVKRDALADDGPARIRPKAIPMSGSRTKATAVPMRPAATAPMATGSSAYVPAIHTLAGTVAVSRRAARYAVTPAAGTQPSSSTSMASQVLPASRAASAATTAR